MLDCWEIKQGMLIYIVDDSEGTQVQFKGEHYPKKRRPWIVVSNDANNAFSTQIHMVPVYTRSETTLPTQVFFKNKGRDQVACCENVTCIPREMIDLKGFIGFVSQDIFKKIQKALSIQFGYTVSEIPDTESPLQKILEGINVENLIQTKLLEILTKGLTSELNLTGLLSSVTNNNKTEETVNLKTATVDNKSSETVEQTKGVEDVDIPKDMKRRGPRKPYGPRGNTMSLEDCLEFYLEVDTLTTEQIYEKWKTFGVKNDKLQISKKKSAIKKRLKDNNLI